MAAAEPQAPSDPALLVSAERREPVRVSDSRADTLAIRLGRRVWDRRAHLWDSHRSSGLHRVVEAVLHASEPCAGAVAIDLGCGTGQLTLPLARRGAAVTGVDVSPKMVQLLEEKARAAHLPSVTAEVRAIEHLSFPAESVDLVVSNYALHHLADRDKAAVVRAAAGWLRPGGRVVVGDMMFGRGASSRDREIILAKVVAMLRRGPAGWWRIAKNVVRFTFRVQEQPVSIETWVRYFEGAGLQSVTATPVVGEAAVVVGVKP
jgi:2-polyprenyl-3-methyl-5-hydroxy-6-metoxy-1,4-benzoquinol methylase